MGSIPMHGRRNRVAMAAAIGLTGVCIVAWFLSRRIGPAGIAPMPSAPALEQAASATAPEPDLRAPPKQLSSFPPWTAAELWPEPVQDFGSQRPPARPPTPGSLWGRIIAYSPEGALLPPSSGEFTLTFCTGPEGLGTPEDVSFSDGRWSLEDVPSPGWDRLQIQTVRVGELYATIDSPLEIFGMPAGGELNITVTLPRTTSLRVTDALTGLELEGVEIVRPRPFPLDGVPHPGASRDERVLMRGARSPVTLPQSVFGADEWQNSFSGVKELRVGVEGYAWTDVSLDLLQGGERAVGLQRGAALEVRLVGDAPAPQAELRVRIDEEPRLLAAEPVPPAGTLHLAGLPPGRCRVCVEVGTWWQAPRVLGSLEVELFPGATTKVDLALEALPSVERAEASGWILVPEAWEVDSVRPHLVFLDTSFDGDLGWIDIKCRREISPRGGHTAFAWTRDGLQLGRYELSVFRPRGSMVFEVVPGGVRDVVLMLPPPVELLVRLVEAGTAVDIRTDDLHWHPKVPDGVKAWSSDPFQFDSTTGLYRARVPNGPIVLTCWTMAYESFQRELDPAEIPGVLTVELQPAMGIAIGLHDGDGDAAIAFPQSWQGTPVAVGEHGGKVGLTRFGKFLREFQVSAPGSYTLELPEIAGYQPAPPQHIDVRPGEFTRVDVELRRGTRG